ncbi:hypothetical protein Afil01_29240 [Actinorhabdospora filicis]|uniref:Bulb-type lectin domain-containing protein n=1 Tax=Actinorhabdospora filicis TaxID=1785913 RepID=A0A9W6SLH7_9ACTN|nr:hypothetical protein [Actinorhabdospora filicis]GLZ78117.1 hypothetical protein Afil01_29240 [Actinorhabdospora filicis]
MRYTFARLAGVAAILLATIVFATPAQAGVAVGQYGGGCLNARTDSPKTYTEWLSPNWCLYEGDKIEANKPTTNCPTAYCVYWLVYQSDGNLVEYVMHSDRWKEVSGGYGIVDVKWASNTGYHGAGFTRMQGDGNLVIYGNDGQAKWSSDTGCHGTSALKMQTDGNLVIYRVSDWAPTWEHGLSLSPWCNPDIY